MEGFVCLNLEFLDSRDVVSGPSEMMAIFLKGCKGVFHPQHKPPKKGSVYLHFQHLKLFWR